MKPSAAVSSSVGFSIPSLQFRDCGNMAFQFPRPSIPPNESEPDLENALQPLSFQECQIRIFSKTTCSWNASAVACTVILKNATMLQPLFIEIIFIIFCDHVVVLLDYYFAGLLFFLLQIFYIL